MSRKFFSGLPDRMMKGNAGGVNRQQTNFYWPNETDTEQFVPSRNRMRNRSMSTASLMSQSQASSDAEESRRRKSQHNQSKIEFYDMPDAGTDTESVYSRNKGKKQETLKSRIEFYDFVDTRNRQMDDDVQSVIERPVKRNPEPSVEHIVPMTSEKKNEPKSYNESVQNIAQSVQNLSLSPEPKNGYAPSYSQLETPRKKASQYNDSFSESDEEERFFRQRNHAMEERKYRYPPSSQRSVRSHPRRFNSEYFDYDDDVYDRHYESTNRRLKYRKPENLPRMARRRDYSPELSDEEFYDNVDGYRRESRARMPERFRSNDSESYHRGRTNRRTPSNGYGSEMDFQRSPAPPQAPSNGYGSEMDFQRSAAPAAASTPSNGHRNEMPASARPPVKPLARTASINEAKQRLHVNLRSNIFHNDPEYDVLVEQRKPLSIRDFAARQRVGVGLPDI